MSARVCWYLSYSTKIGGTKYFKYLVNLKKILKLEIGVTVSMFNEVGLAVARTVHSKLV